MTDLTEIFGPLIHSYTRAEAIEDGVLVDVTETAREAGYRCPVALTRGAWEDCVAWSEEDTDRKGWPQDEAGRLWDVLWMSRSAVDVLRCADMNRAQYRLQRVPRDGRGHVAQLTTLDCVIGPGDAGELVVTIMLPEED